VATLIPLRLGMDPSPELGWSSFSHTFFVWSDQGSNPKLKLSRNQRQQLQGEKRHTVPSRTRLHRRCRSDALAWFLMDPSGSGASYFVPIDTIPTCSIGQSGAQLAFVEVRGSRRKFRHHEPIAPPHPPLGSSLIFGTSVMMA
jgi:hypothetical protein